MPGMSLEFTSLPLSPTWKKMANTSRFNVADWIRAERRVRVTSPLRSLSGSFTTRSVTRGRKGAGSEGARQGKERDLREPWQERSGV